VKSTRRSRKIPEYQGNKPETQVDKGKLRKLEQTGARHRLRDLARSCLDIKAFDEDYKALVVCIAEKVAETKQELADIINVAIFVRISADPLIEYAHT